VYPRPHGDRRPLIWIGGYHDVVLDRTARLRAAGLADARFPGTQPDVAGLADRRDRLDGMLEREGIDPVEAAVEYLVEGYEKQYRGRGHEPSARGDLGHDVIHDDYDPMELIEDRFVVGSPDDWVEEIRAYDEAMGVDHLTARICFEGMDHGDVMDQLELLCDEVEPRL